MLDQPVENFRLRFVWLVNVFQGPGEALGLPKKKGWKRKPEWEVSEKSP